MGGQSLKRRGRFLNVWAWRNQWGDYVFIGTHKPEHSTFGFGWSGMESTTICPRIFNKLTELKASKAKGMAPVRIRVPAWTVLKGDDDE